MQTLRYVDYFAKKGYRTLVFAMKELELKNDAQLRKSMTHEFLDKDLKLLGITAVEDLLQDEVSKCISDF